MRMAIRHKATHTGINVLYLSFLKCVYDKI